MSDVGLRCRLPVRPRDPHHEGPNPGEHGRRATDVALREHVLDRPEDGERHVDKQGNGDRAPRRRGHGGGETAEDGGQRDAKTFEPNGDKHDLRHPARPRETRRATPQTKADRPDPHDGAGSESCSRSDGRDRGADHSRCG